MTKHDREYYSLIEAADIPHGVSDGWPSREKFIKDLIHGAANGKLRFIALTSGIKGRLRTICDGATTEPFQTIEHKYCFIHEDHISVFEQNCHRLVIGKRSQRRISDNNLPRLYGVCLELPSVLNPSGDPNTYLEFDEPIYLYIDTLFILNCDLKAYLAQKELTENISIKEYPKDLKTLILAYEKLWANADPKEKDTWRKNDDVETWLKSQGYGNNPAKVGASIIRPDYAKGIK